MCIFYRRDRSQKTKARGFDVCVHSETTRCPHAYKMQTTAHTVQNATIRLERNVPTMYNCVVLPSGEMIKAMLDELEARFQHPDASENIQHPTIRCMLLLWSLPGRGRWSPLRPRTLRSQGVPHQLPVFVQHTDIVLHSSHAERTNVRHRSPRVAAYSPCCEHFVGKDKRKDKRKEKRKKRRDTKQLSIANPSKL